MLLLLISAVILSLGIRIELNTLRQPIEAAVEQALGRDVEFSGDLSFIPTLWPVIEIRDVKIYNPPDWQQAVFAYADLLRLQLGLVPLLHQQIHLDEVAIQGIKINLLNILQGIPNWEFREEHETAEQSAEIITQDGFANTFTAVNSLNMRDITLFYQDQQLKRSFSLYLDKMYGSALPDQTLKLNIKGRLKNKPYQL